MPIFAHTLFNPNFYHIREAFSNSDIRFIFLQGGSSSAKTVSVVQAVILAAVSKNKESALVFRKVGSSIEKSIYEDFKLWCYALRLDKLFEFYQNKIVCKNGAKIDFSGLDNPEKIKGITNYKRVILEEVSEFDEPDFNQIRKRLRGKPGLQIVSMFNPISENHWIKKKLFDLEDLKPIDNHLYGRVKNPVTGEMLPKEYSEVKEKWTNSAKEMENARTGRTEMIPPNMIVIKSTYLNNFWVVCSPDGSFGFYDRQTILDFENDRVRDYDYYRIYALGEWGSIRTGGEFLHAFNQGRHTGKVEFTPGLPIHLSIDNNVLPYISVSIWQILTGKVNKIRQIGEIAASDPNNTVTAASKLTLNYLKGIGHDDIIYLYGDQTTKASNTIDDEKRSFFDKFKEVIEADYIVKERMPTKNPSVSMTGEFMNAIYAGQISNIDIQVSDTCKYAIEDYIRVKKDENGGILKKRIKDKVTSQSYEESGHFTDTSRYFVAEAFKDTYTSFSLRRKHNTHKETDMKYYDPKKIDLSGCETFVYITPVDGFCAMASGVLKDGRMYIDKASFTDYIPDNSSLVYILQPIQNARVSFEAKESYFQSIRELRSEIDNIRAGKEHMQKDVRINAYAEFVKERFLFRSDYDLDMEYTAFVERFMDCSGKDNIEAANCIAAMAEYVRRNRRAEFENNKIE